MSDLTGVNPTLVERVTRVLKAMDAFGTPMLITDGKRSLAVQQALYAQGRTKPGHIVTNADGIIHPSAHQLGRAVDCCFLVDGKPSWDVKLPWTAYGALVTAAGLKWGGSFSTLHDLPHAELL